MAARQGAERQDLHHPRAHAGDRRPRSAAAFEPAPRRRACSTFPPRRRSSASSTRAASARSPTIPAEDIAFCEGRSHLILAVVKALRPPAAGGARRHRARRAGAIRTGRWWWRRPACTRATRRARATCCPIRSLRRSLRPRLRAGRPARARHQRTLFSAIPGRGALRFVPIDFTQAGDGFEPPDYGREALIEALIAAAPAAVADRARRAAAARRRRAAQAQRAHPGLCRGGRRQRCRSAGRRRRACRWCRRPCCGSWPSCAACSGTERDYAEFAAALGAGTLVRTASSFGMRQLVKLIPVYGQTAGAAAAAAASFAATYAMGKAASYFLARRRHGVHAEEVAVGLPRGAAATPSAWPRSATSATARREARLVSKPQTPARASRASCCWPWRCCCRPLSLIPLGTLWLWEHGYILYWALGSCVVVSRRLLSAAAADRAAAGRGACPTPDDDASAGDARWTPRQDEAWGDVRALAASVDAERMTSRDAVARPRRSRPSRWWPSACIPSAATRCCSSPCRRRWPSSSAPAPTCATSSSAASRSATASPSPSSCGSIAGAARCSWSRRATTCGASCGCSIRSPPPPRSCASASRARSTRPAASTWRAGWRAPSSEVGRAAIDLYGGSLRVSPARLRRRTSRPPRAEDLAAAEAREAEPIRILVAGQTGAGKSSLVNALANAVEAAVDARAGHRALHRLPADPRGPAGRAC